MEIDKFCREQYKLAIDARDKLNDNYHKWMTFYYIANAAVLVAITNLHNECTGSTLTLLSLIGVLVCIFWNLSCRGYNYWSNSWLNIILELERKIYKNQKENIIYGAFSKEVVEGERGCWKPIKSANISTPKLTLLFSFISILLWTAVSIYQMKELFNENCNCCFILSSVLLVIIILTIYLILPLFVKSRTEKHELI